MKKTEPGYSALRTPHSAVKKGDQLMHYRQLKDFFRQREQKAFWIFNYANIVGLFAGLFMARFLAEQIRWLPGLVLFPAAMLGGLACTWPRQGRELYKTWWLWASYVGRRVFASGSLVLNCDDYYGREQTAIGIRPFVVVGRMAYLGDRLLTRGSIGGVSRAAPRVQAQEATASLATSGSTPAPKPVTTSVSIPVITPALSNLPADVEGA